MDALEAIRKRRTVREFTGEEVPRDVLVKIVDAGRLAATGRNMQPWEFIVVTDREKIKYFSIDIKWVEKAGAVIAVVMDPASRWWVEDGSAAVENMLIAATALGYGSCWFGGYTHRRDDEFMPEDNPWGFRVDTPRYKYNRGELYNLSIQRGTLTDEERYVINGHMIETIKMLTELPFPRKLRQVPSIAGSHHETMDGNGYPKRLIMEQEPLTARMMVIADIFEALTASDRPYKKAKTLGESLKIMSFMRNDRHIDPDLFELFLRSGVYRSYAEQFLSAEQIDEVNIEAYL